MFDSIKKILEDATQEQLRVISEGSGVPLPTLNKIKYSQTKNPGVITVESLARYFTLQRVG